MADINPGDTVTAEVAPAVSRRPFDQDDGPKPFTITGEVWEDFGDNPHGPVLRVGSYALGLDNITVIEHTVAPTPRIGWASVHLKGRELPNERYAGFITDSGDFHLLEPDTGTHSWAAREEYDDARPLAVLDSTEETRTRIAKALHGDDGPLGTFDYMAADAVMNEFGLKERK